MQDDGCRKDVGHMSFGWRCAVKKAMPVISLGLACVAGGVHVFENGKQACMEIEVGSLCVGVGLVLLGLLLIGSGLLGLRR